jgi:hypothetical protein
MLLGHCLEKEPPHQKPLSLVTCAHLSLSENHGYTAPRKHTGPGQTHILVFLLSTSVSGREKSMGVEERQERHLSATCGLWLASGSSKPAVFENNGGLTMAQVLADTKGFLLILLAIVMEECVRRRIEL